MEQRRVEIKERSNSRARAKIQQRQQQQREQHQHQKVSSVGGQAMELSCPECGDCLRAFRTPSVGWTCSACAARVATDPSLNEDGHLEKLKCGATMFGCRKCDVSFN